MIKKYLLISFLLPATCIADFKVIVAPSAPQAPAIVYGAPVEASKSLKGSVSSFAREKPALSELGKPTDLVNFRTPGITSFGDSVASILGGIIPRGMQLDISKNTDLSSPIRIDIKRGTLWTVALKQVVGKTNNFAIVDWSSAKVTIGSNKTRDLSSIQKPSSKELDLDGESYVIRKKSDDYSERNRSGYIVKDGKVLRFDAASKDGIENEY